MTTNERIKEINQYFRSHPECVGDNYGCAFATPRVTVNGYTFDEYDNGKCYSRMPWIHYYRITAPNGQELRYADYAAWIRRLHVFMAKHGCFGTTKRAV